MSNCNRCKKDHDSGVNWVDGTGDLVNYCTDCFLKIIKEETEKDKNIQKGDN